MQLLPEVANEYGVVDPFSAEQSIDGGARHMRWLLARYHGDRTLAVAAYNAGVGAVARYGGVPPYAETREYVAKVFTLYAGYRRAPWANRWSARRREGERTLHFSRRATNSEPLPRRGPIDLSRSTGSQGKGRSDRKAGACNAGVA